MRLRRSRLTAGQTEQLLQHFVGGTPARTTAELVRVNRNTARLFYHKLREIIAQHLARASPFKSELEVDEACLAAFHRNAESGGMTGTVPLFGLLGRGDKVYTVMVLGVGRGTSSPVPKTKVRPDALVYADARHVRAPLAVSSFRQQRIAPEHAVPSRAQADSVENFWNQVKRDLQRYNGIPRRHFHLFLKECEWRFNGGSPEELLKTLKSWIRTAPR